MQQCSSSVQSAPHCSPIYLYMFSPCSLLLQVAHLACWSASKVLHLRILSVEEALVSPAKMGTIRDGLSICILVFCICMATLSYTPCDARIPRVQQLTGPKLSRSSSIKHTNKYNLLDPLLDVVEPMDSPNTKPYGVSSPFSLPPFNSLAPIPLPENAPPYCINPPGIPQPPSTILPTPIGYTPLSSPPPPLYIPPILPMQSPPPSPISVIPGPPESTPTPYPPETSVPNPSGSVPSPVYLLTPPIYEPGPPGFEPSPPSVQNPGGGGSIPNPPTVPSPSTGGNGGGVPSPSTGDGGGGVPGASGGGGGVFVPSPPVFQPPVVYPPPTGPPPPHRGPSYTLWCVAKPSVPDPIIQEAMNYACGSGADCASIQPSGSCYQPDTAYAHASYAFNSYWQKTKVAGGTCDFGGTAMLVTVDPSYDGCHFMYN